MTISESLPASKGNFAEGFARTMGAERGEFAIFLPLLQAQLAFEQDPESATGLIDFVEVGAGIGMDQLHRPEASKVLDSERRRRPAPFAIERQDLPPRPAPLANLVEHRSWF